MASEGEVKLLGAWQSPYVLRARIALNVKSVPYEFQQENILETKSELLLKSNPVHKKVPVLIHAGRPVSESLVIVEYIDEVWSGREPILPSDPYDRAVSRFWTTFIDDKWFPSFKSILLSSSEDVRNAAKEDVTRGLTLLENVFAELSKGRKFFGGDKIGYLDIAFGCFLSWIRVTQRVCKISLIDEFTTPGLFKWAEQFCADVAVKDVLPNAFTCSFWVGFRGRDSAIIVLGVESCCGKRQCLLFCC
ncbi:Glutathione S-transferase U17 [Striga hermonthica]|uniref:glutathione transferase n=1 Tax=Striga hermonthica TaxID=68872 RepID=A0A9N7RLP3_STRHE|nr:Glutathione S-transferase U17 [Striga hermonthica]